MSNFITNFLKLATGSATAQVLAVLLIPIITRIYSPDDFGIFQLFASISGIIVVISCFSYQQSIMLPKKDEDSANIVALCIILLTFTSLISGIILLIFADQIGQILNAPPISKYLILLPILIFLNGLFLVMDQWLSRRTRFGVIAISRVGNTTSNKVIQILSGAVGASPLGLIFGVISGFTITNILMLHGTKKDLELLKAISIEKMKELLIRYKKFPLYSSWSSMANTASGYIPSFMLAYFYSVDVVGYYAIAHMALKLPIGFVGLAVGQVFFQKVNEVKNQNRSIKPIVNEVHKKLISIGIFPMIILMILSEQLFVFIFGSEWYIAGTYSKILIPWIFLAFVSAPLKSLFSVFEKQDVGLSFNLILLISRIISLYIGGLYGGPIFAISLFTITGVVFWGGMNLYLLKISEIDYKESIGTLIRYTLRAVIISIPLIVAKYLSLNQIILFIVAGIVMVIYYLAVFYEDEMLRKQFFILVRGVKKWVWKYNY